MLLRSRKLLSMPVVSLADGQGLGRVRALVVDPKGLAVVGLILDSGGLFKELQVVPFKAVKSVGEHAVTVEEAGVVSRLSQMPELIPLVRRPVSLVGARVISEDGKFLGTAEEYWFDGEGRIRHFTVGASPWQALTRGKGELPIGAVRAVGQNSIVVRAGAEEEIRWEGGRISRLREGWQKLLHPGQEPENPPPQSPT